MTPVTTTENDVLQGLKALKVSKFGRPYQKDTWDIACSLALVLRPTTVKQRPFGKTHYHAFLGIDAVKCLESLTFIRSPDRNSRATADNQIPTILTLRLPNEDARKLMQYLIEARIIQDLTASGPGYTQPFSKKSIYRFTVKGLLIIADLIHLNGLSGETEHLSSALSTLPPVQPNLSRDTRHRSAEDDSFVVSNKLVTSLFHRFTGDTPNYGTGNGTGVFLIPFTMRNKLLQDIELVDGVGALGGRIASVSTTHCFQVSSLVQWMCSCTSINSEVEAAEFAAHFVRFGLITAIPDTMPKKIDPSKMYTVTGALSSSNPWISEQGQFVNVPTVVYAITEEGRRIAGWVIPAHNVPIIREPTNTYDSHLSRERSAARFSEPFDVNSKNAIRLKTVLRDPVMRNEFRNFLAQRNYQHNISFWMDVEDFKAEMDKAAKGKSRARRAIMREEPVASSSNAPMQDIPVSEEPANAHAALGERPFLMYNTYFAPESTLGLRVEIGEDLAQELQQRLGEVLELATAKAMSESVGPSFEDSMLDIDQLQVMLDLYGRVQSRVFRNMAVRYIPRFMKSPQFISTRLALIADENPTITENGQAANPTNEEEEENQPLIQK